MAQYFKNSISQIFIGVSAYHENPLAGRISFKVHGNECSLSKLAQLSDLLGTDAINFTGQKETYQLSSCTSETETYGEIDCMSVVFPV